MHSAKHRLLDVDMFQCCINTNKYYVFIQGSFTERQRHLDHIHTWKLHSTRYAAVGIKGLAEGQHSRADEGVASAAFLFFQPDSIMTTFCSQSHFYL